MAADQPRTFEHRTRAGHVLHGILHFPEEPGPRPTVLICHGFKGFMEWGFFPYLADLLASRGFTVARFNFSGSGMRPGEDRVTDPEAFRTATLGKDVTETTELLTALASDLAPGRVDGDRIGLFGHSRGGGTAVVAAAAASTKNSIPIRALVTWAAVPSFDYLGTDLKEEWRRDGEITIVNGRTGQELPIGLEILEELDAKNDWLDPSIAARKLESPWLIVHGEADETVPVAAARVLERESAGTSTQLHLIESGDHTLGARHPFQGPTPELIEAMNATQGWYRRHLK